MKIVILIIAILFFGYSKQKNNSSSNYSDTKATNGTVYKIVLSTPNSMPVDETDSIEYPGAIDTTTIILLDEHLRALTAFYSAMGGTMCNGDYCELTTALGLGKQGSEQHKDLIKKYFPDDKVAELV